MKKLLIILLFIWGPIYSQQTPPFSHLNIITTEDYKTFEFCIKNNNGKMILDVQTSDLPIMKVDQEELSCKGALFLGRDWMEPNGNTYDLQEYTEFYYTAIVNDTIVALLISKDWEYDIPDAQIVWNIDYYGQLDDTIRVYTLTLYNEFYKKE